MIRVDDDPQRWTRAGCLFLTLWLRYPHPHTLAHGDAHRIKRALLHRETATDPLLDIAVPARFWRALGGAALARLHCPEHRAALASWLDRIVAEHVERHGELDGERRGLAWLLDALREERGFAALAQSVWRTKVS